jgi:dihydroflavonol-4-reductase
MYQMSGEGKTGMAGTVLVTGASGYIAGFAIQQLLREGWQVRGTIRNLARADEVLGWLGVNANQLPLFAADLTSDAGWAEAAAGCTHMLHIASPIPASAPKHDDELVVPARDGALRALKAAKAAGVKRVVLTSSTAAVTYGKDVFNRPFTEADWTDETHPDTYAYVRSKTIAERAARDWIKANGAEMEFATINPGLILGPVLGRDFSTSLEALKKLLEGALPGLPRLGFPVTDVRDVADAHVRALTHPGIDGERFLVAGEFLWLEDIARVLKARLGPKARRVPSKKLPDFLVKLSALFDPTVKMVLPELGRARAVDSGHVQRVLGVKLRPAEETILDTAKSLLETGIVKV